MIKYDGTEIKEIFVSFNHKELFSTYHVALNLFQLAQMSREECKRYDCSWPQKKLLPHRYPHVLIERIKIKLWKCTSENHEKNKIKLIGNVCTSVCFLKKSFCYFFCRQQWMKRVKKLLTVKCWLLALLLVVWVWIY